MINWLFVLQILIIQTNKVITINHTYDHLLILETNALELLTDYNSNIITTIYNLTIAIP